MQTTSIPTSLELLNFHVTSGSVCDIGCYGWKLLPICNTQGRALTGVDTVRPSTLPETAKFALSTEKGIELPDGHAEVTVATHVIERVADGTAFFTELVRITAPGGFIYLEAPSELSAVMQSSDTPQDQSFSSFWDDPTHIRPWTPGAFYRLALSTGVVPLAISRNKAGPIPVVRMLAHKPIGLKGANRPRYVSLESCPSGLSAAWNKVWGTPLPLCTPLAIRVLENLKTHSASK